MSKDLRLHSHQAVNFNDMAVGMVSQWPMRTDMEKMQSLLAANYAGQLMQLAQESDEGIAAGDISGFVERKKEALLRELPKADRNDRRQFFRIFEKVKQVLEEAMAHAINGTEPESHGRGQ